MITAITLLVMSILMGWHWRASSHDLQPVLANGYRAEAIVREYSMPNALDQRSYPYVEYTAADGHAMVQRLEYSRSKDQKFTVGQKIAVVSYQGHLYYEPALSSGNNAVLHLTLALGIGAVVKLLDSFFSFL